MWDDRYTPFSAFEDGECVASICVYPSVMRVDGKDKSGAQLLTVGTLPEYRGRGIQKQLWRRAHEWLRTESDFVFLFTDEEAVGFYERLGLKRQPEYTEIIPGPHHRGPSQRVRQLDPERDDDFALVEHLAREREVVSDRLGFLNPNLLLFMFLYEYGGWTFYLEDLDAVIVAEETARGVRIHDILARAIPSFREIGSFLSRFGKDVEFLFCTDRLDVGSAGKRRVDDSVLMVSEDFTLRGEFVFPYSMRA